MARPPLSRREVGLAILAGAMMPAMPSKGKSAGHPSLQTGAEHLARDAFSVLRGKRVGLVTNHTARVGDAHLIDLMVAAPGVTLAAILAPEHGLRGNAEAGAKVTGSRDPATGVIIHSLYGKTYKPTPGMLDGFDALVFDMQDIGTRFYTYISTMGLCMQAAAAARLPFIVLDRPNPLGGIYVSGFVLEKAHASFVGRYPIPIAHGLTAGELARMIQGERLLPGLTRLALEIVPLEGWRRDTLWPATRRPWLPTSPNIPTFETALAYPGTGLFEATTASEGRGTDAPFLTLGHLEIDATAVARTLAEAALPGVSIAPTRFRPRAIARVATNPRFRNRTIDGIRLSISNPSAFQPVETGIHCLSAFARALAARGTTSLVQETSAFDRLAGTSRLRRLLAKGTPAPDIIASWQAELDGFIARRQPYLLYA